MLNLERIDGVEDLLHTIFGGLIVSGLSSSSEEDRKTMKEKFEHITYFVSQFKAIFPMQVFEGYYAILYELVVKQNNFTFSEGTLKTAIEQNFDLILDSPYIDLSNYSFGMAGGQTTRQEKLEIFKDDMGKLFRKLSRIVVAEQEFMNACQQYIYIFREEYMAETCQNMALVMSESGFDYKKIKRRTIHLHGYEDAQRYYNERLLTIKSLDRESGVVHTVYDENAYADDIQTENTGDALMDYGIDEIDEVKGQMRRGNMVEVMGPPKGGKTTFTTFQVERALSKGLNVAVWPLEGTADEWKSLIIALMVRMDPRNNGMVIDKKDILNRSYKSEDEKIAAESARLSLACGYYVKNYMDKERDTSRPMRGRLSFIDGPAYVEDFEGDLQTHYEEKNPFDVIVIDSPINILSRTGKPKVERISECYMLLKAYVSKKMKKKALCLCTAQLKQSAVDYLRQHPEETISDTAGAESAESIRTPDEVIGVFSTEKERNMNRMKLYSVASRHNRGFLPCYIECQLGCGYFRSNPELNSL